MGLLKLKWSKRIRECLIRSGKSSLSGDVWSESQEYADKKVIANTVARNPKSAVHPARESVILALISAVESKLKSITNKA